MSHHPIILGIVGDSAAGKTTLAAGIASILGRDQVTTICVDDYHRYDRAERKVRGITPLHPACNYLDIMEQHLACLAEGEPILKPRYNHHSGVFDPPEYVQPKQFVIIEGLLGFATPKLRNIFQIKVYLDPPEELRRRWKIKRDCSARGYTPDEVVAELAKRESDSVEFIHPQCSWADMVVRFFAREEPPHDERLNVGLRLRSTLVYPDLNEVIQGADHGPPALQLRVGRDEGRLTEFLDIDGRVTPTQTAAIEDVIWAHMPELEHLRPEQIGTFVTGQDAHQSNTLGLTQLLVAHHLLLARLEKEQAPA